MSPWKYKSEPVSPSEITPEPLYRSRRQFLQAMGLLGAGALLAACAPAITQEQPSATTESIAGQTPPAAPGLTDELGDPANSFEEITGYNNFYEFTTSKEGVAGASQNFVTDPWKMEVYGLCDKPTTYSTQDLLSLFPSEERIYRLRCVEGWSMVIPWQGFELGKLLAAVAPTSQAKFVRFETLFDPEQFPAQDSSNYPWPYQEGLTLAEAMHPLTLLATGLYGKSLPPQNGAPMRLVVPWKYGFKSIKSIVKVELVDTMPATLWSTIAPNEYGFYANVNPEVPHPRWSQASERRIGELARRPTLMFNGYEKDVADLYADLDLEVNY